jgi:hypothetical protein
MVVVGQVLSTFICMSMLNQNRIRPYLLFSSHLYILYIQIYVCVYKHFFKFALRAHIFLTDLFISPDDCRLQLKYIIYS